MFTGLVNHCAVILSVDKKAQDMRLTIKSQFTDLQEGESIAVNGICLTVLNPDKGQFDCDVSHETLAVTQAAEFCVDMLVNVERAMRPIDRFGGHIVLGHVDCTGTLVNSQPQGDCVNYEFALPVSTNKKFLTKKGCIAVNGVSLTINALSVDGFMVTVIPHSLQRTNLHLLVNGSKVNIEFDYIARFVVREE